ncbi:MAG TPA: ATP-binding cassette domain-containing protein [Kineosporiaceae bacterium]|nr:ATP-binding cassette domain-containing protein [Kineosporiaceae bacterium]
MPPLLRVEKVTHHLGGAASAPVLRDVDLEIGGAQLVALVGRSGSGKSTLCHLVTGLGTPGSGRILVAGRPADQIQDWAIVALLPQRLALVEELSIAENILLPTVLAGRRPEADARMVIDALGLEAVADRLATQVSLGEQQRAALARALVLRPRLAVLDEPTGHQDDDHVELVLQVLAAARDRGTAVLIATHDDRVLEVADRVVRLHLGQVVTHPAPS